MSIESNIEKIKVIPFHILIKKILDKVKGLVTINNVEEDRLTFSDIQIDDFRLNPNLFNEIIPDINTLIEYKDSLENYCQGILDHKMDILGSGSVDISNEIDRDRIIENNINLKNSIKAGERLKSISAGYKMINWNKDFKSGYTWDSKTLSKYLKYGNMSDVDVKIPWEIGRLQHLCALSYCAVLNKTEKNLYLEEYQNQIIDFIATNPPGYGIQWKSTMDSAIRVINIIFSYQVLRSYNLSLKSEVESYIIQSIYQHSDFIYKNLEWNNGLRANHFLFNILGLFVCESFFSKNWHSSRILKFSYHRMCEEILYQFNEDGGNFEASLPYHFFASEAVFLFELLLNGNNLDIPVLPSEVKERIFQIKEFCSFLSDSNGKIPQIGDNDSGYVLKYHPKDIPADDNPNVSHVLRYFQKNSDNTGFKLFPDFGLYSKNTDDFRFTLRCGSLGQRGKGGHAHNDQLSITLSVSNQEFIVDTGTFCYTPNPAERNKYRCSNMHNTVTLKDKEQNKIYSYSADDLFWMFDKSKGRFKSHSSDNAKAAHIGFGFETEREVLFNDRSIIGTDSIDCKDRKYIQFHLHPNVRINEIKDGYLLNSNGVEIKLFFDTSGHHIEDYEFSPCYGIKILSKKVVLISKDKQIKWYIKY